MSEILVAVGWLVLGVILGAVTTGVSVRRYLRRKDDGSKIVVSHLVKQHFHPVPLDNITLSERQFPFRVRADLQRALTGYLEPTPQSRTFAESGKNMRTKA